MKISIAVLLLLVTTLFISCKDETENPVSVVGQKGTLKITGLVSLNGLPIEGADITIINSSNLKTKTGKDGRFILEGLTKGEHVLRAEKSFINNSSSFQLLNLILVKDVTDAGEVKLPVPVALYNIEAENISQGEITLKWSKSSLEGFQHYKVFRRDSLQLDESNSELVFISFANSDTQYTIKNVKSGVRHYYKVYCYTSSQNASASNPQFIDVPEFNMVVNPGFEDASSDNFPDNWRQLISGYPQFKYFTRSQEAYSNGRYSLKIYYSDALAFPPEGHNPWGGIMQTLPGSYMVPGREYTLSFWVRSRTGGFQIRIVKNGNLEDATLSYIVPDKLEWTEQRLNFKIEEGNYYELWISVRPGFAVNGTVTGFIDDIKLLR